MYQAFDQIVFRFPHYPLEVIKKALSQKEYFQEMIRSDFFEEAIYFASPDLYEELQKYKAGKIKEKDYIRVENAPVQIFGQNVQPMYPVRVVFFLCNRGKGRSVRSPPDSSGKYPRTF